MPYTLSMALLWVSLAVLLGIVVGWLMRSVVAKRQIERARSNHLDNVELERLRSRVAELEPVVADRDRLRDELDTCREAVVSAPTTVASPASPADETGEPVGGEEADALAIAAAVLGTPVRQDDLTLIVGIGPTIADLCTGIGIQTWRDLAQTEVSLLRTMLHDAGARFKSHDPSTWPEQAALLADGHWEEFRAFAERSGAGDAGG